MVERFFSEGGRGLNVTAPFKQDAFAWVHSPDPLSHAARAVNTIVKTEDGISGFNTDGLGLIADLSHLKWELENQRVLILGAGGAAMGIVQPLLDVGCVTTVANRTYSKAVELQSRFPQIRIKMMSDLKSGWDIVINSTSNSNDPYKLPMPMEVVNDAKCYDLTYSRTGRTPFIQAVELNAQAVSDGLGMLIEQAAASFHIWRAVKPNTQLLQTQLRRNNRQPLRRFLAGGVCEKCSAEDRVYIEYDADHKPLRFGCIACGYLEDRDGTTTLRLEG